MRKKKIIKIVAAIVSSTACGVFTYYYQPPSQFAINNAFPITLFTFFLFSAVFTTSQLFTTVNKALLISLTITSTLFVKHIRIIPIITYAICLPLLLLRTPTELDDEKVGEL